jgi:general secretion pathway protein G
MRGGKHRKASGVTLVELVCVTTIILVLAAVAMPVANTMVKRKKELELRQALRTIRQAIDRFQFDATRYQGIKDDLSAANDDFYPEDLAWLVEGVDTGEADRTKLKYLRRMPRDPFTGEFEWGTRSSKDGPDSLFSDGINIFDVYSLSGKIGLNDEPYKKW